MASQQPTRPIDTPLPPHDVLIDAIRQGFIVQCEHTIRQDALYVLGTAPGGASWVFVQRPSGTALFPEIDDPQALYAALAVPGSPEDPLAQRAFEALLVGAFRDATLRRREAGLRIGLNAAPLAPAAARALGREAAQQAEAMFPVVPEEMGGRNEDQGGISAEDLHSLVNGPKSISRPHSVSWTERPLGQIRDELLPRLRTENLVAALAADRASRMARAEANALLREAEGAAGNHPEALLALAEAESTRASALRWAADDVRVEQALRSSLPPATGASERLARELISARRDGSLLDGLGKSTPCRRERAVQRPLPRSSRGPGESPGTPC